jgi:hypothetical protein
LLVNVELFVCIDGSVSGRLVAAALSVVVLAQWQRWRGNGVRGGNVSVTAVLAVAVLAAGVLAWQ